MPSVYSTLAVDSINVPALMDMSGMGSFAKSTDCPATWRTTVRPTDPAVRSKSMSTNASVTLDMLEMDMTAKEIGKQQCQTFLIKKEEQLEEQP